MDAGEITHLDALDLTHLREVHDIWLNHDPLTTLVKRFHIKTNIFHFPLGEMKVTPKDIYQILRIPFHGPCIEYDTHLKPNTLSLRDIFHDDIIMGRAIPWEDLIQQYGQRHRLAIVLEAFLGCYLIHDKGHHRLECGWGRMLQHMLEYLAHFGLGQCTLAHIFHEMHEITCREAKSMAVGVYVL